MEKTLISQKYGMLGLTQLNKLILLNSVIILLVLAVYLAVVLNRPSRHSTGLGLK